MRQNIYLFSNSILRKKNNTLCLQSMNGREAVHEADIDENEQDVVLIGKRESEENGKSKFVPAQNIDSVFAFGEMYFTSGFLSCMAKYSIPVHFFNYYGNYTGSFVPKEEINSGNIALLQAECYLNPQRRLAVAKSFVKGAYQNALANLKYYQFRGAALESITQRMEALGNTIDSVNSVGALMGIEGNIKNVYYEGWKTVMKQELEFEKRVKNPPDNVVNSLISFGNAMMYSTCLNEIYRTGLVPSIGFLHSPGDNRLPLSFDLAEIFKPVVTDKVIFKLINLGMITEKDFNKKTGFLRMNEDARKKFVQEFEERLKTTIMHKELKRSVSYKTLVRLECHNLINYLKSQKEYQPYKSSN
jgi:CRISPR-associated protein Cas1